MEQYVMAIDQGTTSSRAILFNHENEIVASAQKEFTQIFRQPGWVEHDANEIWLSVLSCMATCIQKSGVSPSQVVAIGITNQRETTVLWDKDTGLPVCNAIVWQSRQTADICEELKAKGYEQLFHEKTGLTIDPYFSATKIRWMLDHTEGAIEKAKAGKLMAGTIDSYLIYCLSGNRVHATDYTNASRTLLYNIHTLEWDKELCDILDIPMSLLPEVKDSCGIFAKTAKYHFFGYEVPIAGVAGDQQAALFGQNCFEPGDVKNTYGTGCFLLMNTGSEPKQSNNGLVTTIAWGMNGKITYALEGSVFVAGSAIQWLRDQMKFFPDSKESEDLARSADPNSGVILVPAFVGLGAPYWDDQTRGAIFGITRGTSQADITRATLDALAYQTKDVVKAMESDCGFKITNLKADGGASMNNILMQFQSDLLQCKVERPSIIETTAMGAAHLAGLAVGFWKDFEDCKQYSKVGKVYTPQIDEENSEVLYKRWQKAIQAARMFD